MYKYKHTKTGRIVTTTCPVKGEQWEALTEDQELPADDEGDLTEDQELPADDESDLTEDRAPAKPAKSAKPAKKGKK